MMRIDEDTKTVLEVPSIAIDNVGRMDIFKFCVKSVPGNLVGWGEDANNFKFVECM